jgi:hypothetical protein
VAQRKAAPSKWSRLYQEEARLATIATAAATTAVITTTTSASAWAATLWFLSSSHGLFDLVFCHQSDTA